MNPNIFQIVTMMAAIVAAGCAVFVAFRSSRWRQSDEWRGLLDRIEHACNIADRWHETPRALGLIEQVRTLESDVIKWGVRMEAFATKADLSEFRGEVRGTLEGMGRALASTESATVRIESHLMERT